MNNSKKISFLTQFIALTVLVLVSMFILLAFIFNNYKSTQKNEQIAIATQHLQIYDLQIDQVFKTKFNFINYDTSVVFSNKFEETLQHLASLNVDKSMLNSINKSFRAKQDELERFKSANSIAINSKSYLFTLSSDINKIVAQNPTSSNLALRDTIDQILAIISTQNILAKDVLNRLNSLVNIIDIDKFADTELINLFKKHYTTMLAQISVMQDNSQQFLSQELSKKLNNFENIIQDQIQANNQNQLYIAMAIFCVTLILFIVFIWLTLAKVIIPISNLELLSSNLASSKANLSSRLKIDPKSELATSAGYINKFIQIVQNSVLEAIESSNASHKNSISLQENAKKLTEEKQTVTLKQDEIKTLTFENEKRKGQLKIIKVDMDDNEVLLKDVKFEIKDESGNIVETLVTDENGEATTKPLAIDQKYTIVETETQKEYVLTEETKTIELTEDEITTITFENEKSKGQPQINITTEIVQKTPNEIFKNKSILITPLLFEHFSLWVDSHLHE